ncbi:MAG: hypothetical protein RIT37_1743 [Bacteroidota bacterium]
MQSQAPEHDDSYTVIVYPVLSFKPRIPARTKNADSNRHMLEESPKKMMPMVIVPMAPIPVHTI